MATISEMFYSQSAGQRLGFLAGVTLIFAVSAGFFLWANQARMVPLFADLTQQDAAEVLSHLEDMKVEYEISADGSAILVDSRVAEETRIKLDGGGLAVNGGEGFELFDDADYGMTEFVQKINYQRALQGELSRTIIALEEVRYARVHLVLPERGLFREPTDTAKASVTVVKQPGLSLSVAQIAGIQQLVASAVDGMSVAAVTVLDERGLVLSDGQSNANRGPVEDLGHKQEVEQYLTAKANRMLTQLFGEEQAVVKIDVSINRDSVQLTREMWQPPEGSSDEGLVASNSRQRKFDSPTAQGEAPSAKALVSENEDVEYRINKTVEQVIKADGQIERMTVSVMVPANTSEKDVEAVRLLIAGAVGLRAERGDIITVFPLPQQASKASSIPTDTTPLERSGAAELTSPPGSRPGGALETEPTAAYDSSVSRPWMLAALVLFAVGVFAIWLLPRRAAPKRVELSEEDRTELLEQVRRWFEEDDAAAASPSGSTEPQSP